MCCLFLLRFLRWFVFVCVVLIRHPSPNPNSSKLISNSPCYLTSQSMGFLYCVLCFRVVKFLLLICGLCSCLKCGCGMLPRSTFCRVSVLCGLVVCCVVMCTSHVLGFVLLYQQFIIFVLG
jgi:hypothetical protein